MTINKHIVFEDLHKFWKYAMQESNAYQRTSREPADRWSGSLSWDEAKSLALKGWKEGLKEVEMVGNVNKVRAVGLVAEFADVDTIKLPACGVASVVIVILVAVLFVIVQASPFKVTDEADPKFVPVIVKVVAAFGQALVGVNEVITGPTAA